MKKFTLFLIIFIALFSLAATKYYDIITANEVVTAKLTSTAADGYKYVNPYNTTAPASTCDSTTKGAWASSGATGDAQYYCDGSDWQLRSTSSGGSQYIPTPPTFSDEDCTAGDYAFDTTTGYACVTSGDWNTWTLTNWNNPSAGTGSINDLVTGPLASGQVNADTTTQGVLTWSEMTATTGGITYAHFDTYSNNGADAYFQLYTLSGDTGTRVYNSAAQVGTGAQPDAYDIAVSYTLNGTDTYMVAVCIESDGTAFNGAYQAEPGSSGATYYMLVTDCSASSVDIASKSTGGASRAIWAKGDNSASR
jgi:hypothetical protein